MSNRQAVTIVATKREDLPLLHAWRQNPVVMNYFHDKEETWEEHLGWWENHPVSYVIVHDGRTIGEVHASVAENETDVGLYVGDPHMWGMGIGESALLLFMEVLKEKGCTCFTAHVHPRNYRSQKVFAKAGFFLSGIGTDRFLAYRKEI